jgi:hypothetical protein
VNERDLLVDCLKRLNTLAFPYYLTGSMASNYWGIPRTTHDIDFVIALAAPNVSRMVEAFSDVFHIDERAVRGAFAPPHQFNVIDTRSSLKIDFWLPQQTPFEDSMFERRVHTTLFESEAWLASAEDVLLHKLFWNKITPSERQLSDAAGIVAVQGEQLDRAYLLRWSDALGVTDDVGRLLGGEIQPKQS